MTLKIEYHENDLIFFDKLKNNQMVVILIDKLKRDKPMVLDKEDAICIVNHLCKQFNIKPTL